MNLQSFRQTNPHWHSFPYWHDQVCNVFTKLDSQPLAEGAFCWGMEHRQMGAIGLTLVASSPIEVKRTKHHISQSTSEVIKFSFQLSGTSYLEQGDRRSTLNPGDWAFYDCTQPYVLSMPESYSQYVIQVSKAQLQTKINHIEALTAQTISGRLGMGKLAWGFIDATRSEYDDIGADGQHHAGTAVVDVLTACINASVHSGKLHVEAQTPLLFLVKQFIAEQLASPELCVDLIAQECHISRRYLHRLFEPEEVTVSEYIRNLRLEQCRQLLLAPMHQNKTITQIALAWGFNSATHFGICFRRKYGMSPSAYRRASLLQA